MATPAISRDVSRQNGEHPGRIVGQAYKEPRLRQCEEAQKGFLHTVEGVIGTQPFASNDPCQAGAVPMYQDGDPAVKASSTTFFFGTA